MKNNLSNLSYDDLITYFKQINQPKFKADQVFDWIHNKYCLNFDDMSNLSKELRDYLKENAQLTNLNIKNKQVSKIDGTTKFLFELEDGNCVETVLMPYRYGNSLCISTQVGCKMGCKFCASTIGGLVRNLNTGEILSQVYSAEKIIGDKISNIVLMGIGEPLDNFDNVVDFLKIIAHPRGRDFSLRSITLSTCGIVPKIMDLADLRLPITLAVSLHAGNDEDRATIMPINKKWNIEQLIDSCAYYFSKTGRRITFEYALINHVNDTSEHALELAGLLKDLNCHINLIPVNPVVENGFSTSDDKSIKRFETMLLNKGYAVTTRRSLGSDISAACGQLRHEDSLDKTNDSN